MASNPALIEREVYKEPMLISYRDKEAGWPSGHRLGLAIPQSRVEVPLWPLARFVLGPPKFKVAQPSIIYNLQCLSPTEITRQGGRVVTALDLQSPSPELKSHSGHLLDLFLVLPSLRWLNPVLFK